MTNPPEQKAVPQDLREAIEGLFCTLKLDAAIHDGEKWGKELSNLGLLIDKYCKAAVPPSEDAPATPQPSNLSEMPLNRDCAKCGWTHMVGTDCPPPQAAFVGSESQQQCAASDEYMRGWNEAEATYQSVIAEHWKTYHAEPTAQPSEKEAKPLKGKK